MALRIVPARCLRSIAFSLHRRVPGAATACPSRRFASGGGNKVDAPPLVYISGEEMTRWASELYLDEWVRPFVDISKWEFYDLSCAYRDKTNDQVLRDAIAAGKRVGAIYKEPTITPTTDQVKEFGLSRALGSPNGAMRRGWNGVSISRDTIHLPGMNLGFKNPCLFDRHAVGGEYGAAFKTVGAGTLTTTFAPDKGDAVAIDTRKLSDSTSAVVVYDNPYDNVDAMAHHFFSRCLAANVTPYIITKKTVFKWQETFWLKMRTVFDQHYRQQFIDAGLLAKCNNQLTHFLSDVATMQIIRWSDGGWGMASHNYDGDVLTDQIVQVHRSPGFLTSVLNGINDDGSIIKEFEASHGTVTDLWKAHQRGEETSLNPLSMMSALIGAMHHSEVLAVQRGQRASGLAAHADKLKEAMYAQMTTPGAGTRDLSGPSGLTTPQFVAAVRARMEGRQPTCPKPASKPATASPADPNKANPMTPSSVDVERARALFDSIDTDRSGTITFDEFLKGLHKLGVAPAKLPVQV